MDSILSSTADGKRRKWYQVSLRAVFALVTVACGVAMWMAYLRTSRDERDVREWLNDIPHVQLWGIAKWESPEERRRASEFDFDVWVSRGRNTPNIEVILQRMVVHHDSNVDLARAAYALGEVGSTDSVPILIRCLDSPDPSLRFMAVEALGKLGDARAVDALGTRLLLVAQRDENALTSIVSALGSIGGEGSFEYLSRAASEADPLVSRIANEQLSRGQVATDEGAAGAKP